MHKLYYDLPLEWKTSTPTLLGLKLVNTLFFAYKATGRILRPHGCELKLAAAMQISNIIETLTFTFVRTTIQKSLSYNVQIVT